MFFYLVGSLTPFLGSWGADWDGVERTFTCEIETQCADGIDEDLDGLTDCADPDCAPACQAECAPGAVRQEFGNGMFGCSGTVTRFESANLCSGDSAVCPAQAWVDNRDGLTPDYNYWTDDDLRFNGDAAACFVSLTTGNPCSAGQPMRVCNAITDPLGNNCNWTDCGWETTTPNEYFGGCGGNLTAGTLCCDTTREQMCADALDEDGDGLTDCLDPDCDGVASCELGTELTCNDGLDNDGDGSTDCLDADCMTDPACTSCAPGVTRQDFGNGMSGCSGSVAWSDRADLCGSGTVVCSGQQWVDLRSGQVPGLHYWTDDDLRYSGVPTACSVSQTVGALCPLAPMRVCTPTIDDALGNHCNWINCGWETTTPNEYFGGCGGNLTAGTLCCTP